MSEQEVPCRALILCAVLFSEKFNADCME